MRCISYEGCQERGVISSRFCIGGFRRRSGVAERQRSGVRREALGHEPPVRTVPSPRRQVRDPFLRASSSLFLSLLCGGVLPGVQRVSLADRCRRFLLCETMSSCTSSYPDRCALAFARTHRPRCLACLTAATGDCAPSNPRVNTRFTSCSYEQQSPDHKLSHAQFSGDGQSQSKVED